MKLTSDQWKSLSALLDEALGLAPAERIAWLAQRPTTEPEVDAALRRLLEQPLDAETLDFLRTMPKFTEVAPALEIGRMSGDELGGYRLQRELGRGGMGTVWLAERIDGQLKRSVALKLPHLGLDARVLSERFGHERDILAALSHRNIARLYDAGVFAEGQPFLALEYVEGQDLISYCTAHRLNLRQRLALFGQVLEAVRYAHARLVVHRDLKPSNILVDDEGSVKLLDFGIAKLLARGAAAEGKLTQIGERALTPDYACPEQILGQPITTAADVYSLGVLLFELLSGERPYQLKRNSRGALEEAILNVDAPAPSAVARDRKAARDLRGDLDAIILKALRKNPEDRYESAAALADDLRRYSADRPVLARRDSNWYRWRRFLVRNWIPISAIGSVFVALVAGVGVALWQAHSAQQAQARADAVKSFIASIFNDTRPAQGKGGMASAAELLERASQRVPRELLSDPKVAAEMDRIITDNLESLGEIDKAREHLEKALQRDTQALGEHDLAVLRLKVQLANLYVLQGISVRVEPLLASVVEDLRALGREGADDLISAIRSLATMQVTHDGNLAVETAREGVAVADRWLAAEDPQRLLAMSTMVGMLRLRARYPEALAVAQRAADLARAQLGKQRPHERLANVEDDLAYVMSACDRPAEAVALARQCLTDISALHSGDSPDVYWAVAVLARALSLSGHLEEAVQYDRRAIQILAAMQAGPDIDMAVMHQRLGETQLEARRPDEALAQLTIADRMTAAAGGDRIGPWRARERQLDRAEALVYLGRLDEAKDVVAQVAARLQEDPTQQWARVAQLNTLVLQLGGQGRTAIDTGNAALRRAQELQLGPRNDAALRVALAQALLDAQQTKEAHALLVQAIAKYEEAQLAISPRLADALTHLGRAQLQLGNASGALVALQRAHEFWQGFDVHSLWAAETAHWYGRALRAAGQVERGNRLLDAARAQLLNSPFAIHRRLVADDTAPPNAPGS